MEVSQNLLKAFEIWLLDGTVTYGLTLGEQKLLFTWMATYRDRERKDLN